MINNIKNLYSTYISKASLMPFLQQISVTLSPIYCPCKISKILLSENVFLFIFEILIG
jgi:hypothetical protein